MKSLSVSNVRTEKRKSRQEKNNTQASAMKNGLNMCGKDSFENRVYAAVREIPYGKVATYGQVAAMSGNGGAARAVGNALHRNPNPAVIPCHRVVNAQGRLAPNFAFGGDAEQQRRLEAEGVEVVDHHVNLKKYQMR